MTSNLLIWVVSLGAIITVAAIIWTMRSSDRERVKRFAQRETLSMDEIYVRFFSAAQLPKSLVLELWAEVAQPLGIPPGKLRPTDRFDDELAPVEQWDDDTVEVQWAANRRLRRIGAQADLSTIKTLGDYVTFFCNLAPHVEPRPSLD